MEPQAKSNDSRRYPSSTDVSFNFVLSVSGFFGNNNSNKNWEKVDSSGGQVLGLIFAGYVPLASQSHYPIIVYTVANYRPNLSHFWANT